jgi:N-acetylmuramic acid 6-phosphate etherase
MQTEQSNVNTRNIDQLSTLEMLRVINNEDRRVAEAVAEALPVIAEAVDLIAERLGAGGRMYYVGAGTSGRLGVLDAVELVPTFGLKPDRVQALLAGGLNVMTTSSEGAEDDRQAARDDLEAAGVTTGDVVVGIAASGRTPYVLAAVEYARQLGAATVGISCNAPAPLLEAAQVGIGVTVGPEVIAGSTRLKAGTAQKLVLNMLSTAAMIKLGKVYGNLMVDVQVTNDKLERRAIGIIAQIAGVDDDTAAELLRRADRNVRVAIVMGRREVDAAEARRLLQSAGEHLRDIIG